MQLKDVSIDSTKVETGAWVGEKYGTPIPEMGDLCLNVRGIGNADWRRIHAKLSLGVPRERKRGGVVDVDYQDEMLSICLRDACLLGWENLTDENGAIPYSKDKANELFTTPDLRRFRDATMWAASMVGDTVADDTKANLGN